MKKVTMLKDDRGAPEGHTTIEYAEGETYELPDFLADYFIEEAKSAELEKDGKPAKNKKGA